MTQARIVLRGAALEEAEELQKVTQLGSITEVINVMFSRYAEHLKRTWVVQPVSPTYAKAEPFPEIGQAIALPQEIDPDFFFNEPLTGI